MHTIALLPQIHGNARIVEPRGDSTPITIETEGARWSFAVSFALFGLPHLEGANDLRAVVDIAIETGAIGLGWASADFSSYLDREVTVLPHARRKAYVPIGVLAACHLVVRNVSADGPSKARIYGIEIRRVSAAEEVAEQLRCSGPIGSALPHGRARVQEFGPPLSPPQFQPVFVETDQTIYSNAVSFALTLPLELDSASEPWLVVDLQVETGAVWIGCTTADYSTYVDRESYVSAGLRHTAYVSLGPRRNAGHAIVRNDSLDGPSLLRIFDMEIRNVTAGETEQAYLRSLDALCLDAPCDKATIQDRSADGIHTIRHKTKQGCFSQSGPASARRETDPRIGGMATMPSRARTFERALASILPQVDRLYVYLDRHTEVPKICSNHPRIVPLLPSEHGEWAACGKLLGLRAHNEPCLYFCFDDDILYPPDYVEALAQALKRQDWRAVVGVHACRLKPPYLSYRRDRDVVEFRQPLAVDCCFDILGTGTIAFHSELFRIDPSDWRYHDMVDLMVAIEAAKRSLPRVSIQRPKNYLRPLDRQQPDSIYVRLAHDDTRETAVMREALRSCSLSWDFSPIAPGDYSVLPRPDIDRVVDTIHGVIAGADSARFSHTGLIDRDRFIARLRDREHPYVLLAASLRGNGSALTIDDSTIAARDAALLARQYGHEVTLFLNGYNVSERVPYHFSRLSAALDSTQVLSVYYEGRDYKLQTTAAKQRFRSLAKRRIDQLGSDSDRQDFVSEIGVHLGVDEIVVPPWLMPISIDDIKELVAKGVDIQNHGWTHTLVGALPPEEYEANIRRGREWLGEVCGVQADFFAVPNGDGLPLWNSSPYYCAWLLLDQRRPLGELAPRVFNRRMLPL